MLGDPDHLHALATQLRSRAEDVRGVAGDSVRAGQAAHWVSAVQVVEIDRVP